jgi:hypothetical protein
VNTVVGASEIVLIITHLAAGSEVLARHGWPERAIETGRLSGRWSNGDRDPLLVKMYSSEVRLLGKMSR